MKFLLFVLILVTIWTQAKADDPHYTPPVVTTDPVVTTTTNQVNQLTSSDGNLALMGLAATGLVFDWGVPNDLQWAIAGAFGEGGNQSIAGGVATRFGAVLLNVQFSTTLNSGTNDYAVVVGGAGRF